MWSLFPRGKSAALLQANSQFEAILAIRANRLRMQLYAFATVTIVGLSFFFALHNPALVNANSEAASQLVALATHATAVNPTAAAATNKPATQTPVASTPVSAVAAPVAPTVPTCIPDNVYRMPATLPLQQPGMQQVIDTPSTYTVYGLSGAQITAQMAACTPVHSTGTGGTPGRYAASTADAIGWSISYSNDGAGTCTVRSVSVSLHINQVFPAWQPTNGASASLSSEWQDYIAKLHAYEQGHVQLDQANAAAILSDLQNFPPTACSDIENAANAAARAEVAKYDAANANYDVVNGFGLKQGIVL